MLTVIDKEGRKYVRFSEFYATVGLNPDNYRQFVSRTITEHQIPTKGVDFIQIQTKHNSVGRPKKDFLISLPFLKTLCFEVSTTRSKEVKKWADRFVDYVLV